MRLKVLKEAEDDIAEIARWYERVNADLAVRFLTEVGDGFALIEQHPKRFNPPPNCSGKSDIRRYLLKSFKYMIVYQVLPKSLLAICVVHCNRHSKHWKKRTRK